MGSLLPLDAEESGESSYQRHGAWGCGICLVGMLALVQALNWWRDGLNPGLQSSLETGLTYLLLSALKSLDALQKLSCGRTRCTGKGSRRELVVYLLFWLAWAYLLVKGLCPRLFVDLEFCPILYVPRCCALIGRPKAWGSIRVTAE